MKTRDVLEGSISCAVQFQLASVRLPDSGTAAESASTAEAPRVLKKRDSEPRLIASEKDDAAAKGAAGPDMR